MAQDADRTEQDRIGEYETAYVTDFGFEAEMVHYRQRLVCDFLVKAAPRHVVEIGCGDDLLAARYADAGGTWDSWTIVEPVEAFSKAALASDLPNLVVHTGFFEDVAEQLTTPPDAIICSGLLHEVPDVQELCRAIAGVMGSETVLHVNVPNATSMHRRLAQAMGLIDDLKTLSARNQSLQQPRVFDSVSLRALLTECGFAVGEEGGHLVKPFTHQQMYACTGHLGREVLDGLFELGKTTPEWASEIWAESKLA